MKHCIACQFHERLASSQGQGQLIMMDVCTNQECSNPIDASALPCGMLRNNPEFCGVKAKYFKQKEEPKPKQEGNVIQLT